MPIKRFALCFVFALLAVAGEEGVCHEVTHHDEEHSLICISAARPESKSESFRACRRSRKLALERQIVQNESVKRNVRCAQCCLDDFQETAQFRILLV
jgi:hypothetical protein